MIYMSIDGPTELGNPAMSLPVLPPTSAPFFIPAKFVGAGCFIYSRSLRRLASLASVNREV